MPGLGPPSARTASRSSRHVRTVRSASGSGERENPHSTWMVCAPAAFPIARSAALSPITTDSSGETPRRLMAYCARSGAGFGRGAESPPEVHIDVLLDPEAAQDPLAVGCPLAGDRGLQQPGLMEIAQCRRRPRYSR